MVGVNPVQIVGIPPVEDLFVTAVKLTQDLGLAKSGDVIVITGGLPIGVVGSTNWLKVKRNP